MAARRPTIVDVARAAGVSKSSVSLAIRGKSGLSETTRARILETARALGYHSNASARALVQGTGSLVGVLVSDLANDYHRDVLAGIESAAEGRADGVLIADGRRDPDVMDSRLDMLLSVGVGGVVVVGAWLGLPYLEGLGSHVPLVVVGRMTEKVARVDTICGDDELGARLATEHVLELGHRDVAFVTRSPRTAALYRRKSFVEVMRQTTGREPMVAGPAEKDDAITHIVESVVAGRPVATAVFAGNDAVAAEVMNAAQDAGVRVPGDLSIVGYDDTSLCTRVRPALTSVHQPCREMGRTAFTLLAERMAGRTLDRHLTARPHLVVRESTAPVSS